MSTVVFDLDGVIADHRHRLHLIGVGREPGQPVKKDWDQFYALVSQDTPHEIGSFLVRMAAILHSVVYISGRRESTRLATVQWLEEYSLPPGRLFLREDGDYRPAAQVKREALAKLRDVRLVVDDDPQVCAELSKKGYACLEATWGLIPGLPYKQVPEEGGISAGDAGALAVQKYGPALKKLADDEKIEG